MADLSSIGTNAFGLLKKVSIMGPAVPGVAGGVKAIEFDCAVTESHDSETVPTEFEVENGSVMSDHVVMKPRVLKLSAIISDAPLQLFANLLTTGLGYVTPSTGNLGTYAGAVALAPALVQSLDPRTRKSVTAFEALIKLQMARQPVSVYTSLHQYKNMWIRKISIPRDAQTGRALVVNIDFQQLLLVQPQTVTVDAVKNPDVGSSEKQAGDKGFGDNALIDATKDGIGSGVDAVGAVSGVK